MDYVVIGGDERYAQLARLLKRQGKRVGLWGREPVPGIPAVEDGELEASGCLIAGCPARVKNGLLSPEMLLERMGGGAKLALCGPKHPAMEDDRVIDLWSDEALIRENAGLTAEGAMSAAMRASSRAMCDMRCLVIGWGRIGRALTERLAALNAAVTVASRRPQGRNGAVERGAEIQFDEIAQSPYFTYYDRQTGVEHEVWFEDVRSMDAKLRLIAQYGLQGAGYWNLMRAMPQNWTLLHALYEIETLR